MGENKKVDGIRKIGREELIKSRKLVLEAIKESEKNEKSADEKASQPKKLDGIFSKKGKFSPEILGKREKSALMAPDFAHDRSMEAERGKESEEAGRQAEEKKRQEQAEQAEINRKREERQKLQAAEREAESRKQLQEKKRQEEAERQAEAMKAKAEAREKRIALKQQRRKARKKKLKAFVAGLRLILKFGAFKACYYFFVFTVLAVLFYLLWLVTILKLDIDNQISRQAAEYIPTPAIITGKGIIEYYQYKDYKDYVLRNTPAGYTNFKLLLAKEIIKNNLMAKYQIKAAADKPQEEIKSLIEQAIAYDESINAVGLGRIKKIKELIENGGDFIQVANKYGDKQGLLNITDKNESDYPFSEEAKALDISEISDIIIAPEGYYIFKCYEKSINISGLSYVFIEAKSLDVHLNEEALKLRLWNLAR